MAGLTIIGVKVVGMCSKCRKKHPDAEVMKDKYGRVYKDKEISCVGCAFKQKKE